MAWQKRRHHEGIGDSEAPLGVLSRPALALAPLLGLLIVSPNRATAEPLSEAKAIQLAGEHAPGLRIAAAKSELATILDRGAGHHPNPSLGWSSEEGGRRRVLSANLPLEFGRARAARFVDDRAGAEAFRQVMELRSATIMATLDAFHDTAIAQHRLALQRRSLAELRHAETVLAKREAAGQAAGYHQLRLAAAADLAHSRMREAEGELLASRHRLAQFTGQPAEGLAVIDHLELLKPRRVRELVDQGPVGQGIVHWAKEHLLRARRAEVKSAWSWLPSMALSVGIEEHQDAPNRGLTMGLELELPIIDSRSRQRQTAAAQRQLARAELTQIRRTTTTQIAATAAHLEAARTALEDLNSNHSAALLRAAESGYAAGERSLLELLDAQQAQRAIDERRLELLRTAKRAETRLRLASGDLDP